MRNYRIFISLIGNRSYPAMVFSMFLFLFSCAPVPMVNQNSVKPLTSTKYGPRWSDFNEWGKLKLGMEINEVIMVMGEPYMPEKAYFDKADTIEVIIFKIKPKYYLVRKTLQDIYSDLNRNVIKSGYPILDAENKINSTDDQRKPEKSEIYNEWSNDSYNLYCEFLNRKLVKYYCKDFISD